MYKKGKEKLQNILSAIINVDNDKLLEDFVTDLDVSESESDSESLRDTTDFSYPNVDPILNYAIRRSSRACVEVLLKRSLSTDSMTHFLVQDLYSSATLAATLGNAKILDVIIRTVEDIDTHKEEKLIHVIAGSKAKDSVECLRLLLDDHGEDIEVRNKKNQTPLHVAAIGE